MDTQNVYVATETLQTCPYCTSMNLRLWCTGYDRVFKASVQQFTFSKCQKCGLIFQSLRPIEAEIYKFYPDTYVPYQAKIPQNTSAVGSAEPSNLGSMRAVVKRIFPNKLQLETQKIYTPKIEGKTLLDFGCGSPSFLDNARQLGWKTLGMDFSEKVIERVQQAGHTAFVVNTSVWDNLPDKSLDFVRMNHVLEHLYKPNQTLATIESKMKSGAILHVAIPNAYGASAKIFRNRWRGLDCPRHILFYSPKMLKELLLEIGFSDVKIFYEPSIKDFLGSWEYLCCEKGWNAGTNVSRSISHSQTAVILNMGAKLLSMIGVADSFHVVARLAR